MLNIKKLLTKILQAPQTYHSATLASGVTGWCVYVKCGRLVTVQGVLTITSAKAAGDQLVTGLPRPYGNYTIGSFSAFAVSATFRITDSGGIALNTALAVNSNPRFAFSYLSA